MKLREFIVTEAITPELKASDRDGAIRELVARDPRREPCELRMHIEPR